MVSAANPTITTTASPAITLGTTAPTLSDSAVLAGGYYETGSLTFTLTDRAATRTRRATRWTGHGNGTYTATSTAAHHGDGGGNLHMVGYLRRRLQQL